MLHNTYGALYREPGELLQELQEFAGGADNVDIACFNEIWQSTDQDLPPLPGMGRRYAAPRPGRQRRGGVAAYLADTLACRVAVWKRRAEDGVLWLRLQGIQGLPADLLLAVCYLPPQNSGGCPADTPEWWAKLAEETAAAQALGLVLVAGDLNARTATEPDWPADNPAPARNSQDATCTARGRQLLAFCIGTDMRICNGRVAGDEQGCITSRGRSGEGRSVVDYFIACPRLMPLLRCLRVSAAPPAGLDHCILRLDITLTGNNPVAEAPPPAPAPTDFIIDPDLIPQVEEQLRQGDALAHLQRIQHMAQSADTPALLAEAQQCFDALICQCLEAAGMQRRPAAADRQRSRPKRSAELKRLRRQLRQAVRRRDWAQVARLNTLYRRQAQAERRQRRQRRGERLARLLHENPKEFFARYRPPRPAAAAHLTADMWQLHFRRLLGAEPQPLPVPPPGPAPGPDALQEPTPSQPEGSLNTPFTEADVLEAVRKTKNGKVVVGPLKPVVLKRVAPLLASALAALFNACVRVGRLPPAWALSAITPIPKAGCDTNICDGYRGIAVGTLPAKLFASILDCRLSNWAEASRVRAEGQFGFRRKRSCAQAAFVLRTTIERVRARGGKLYACFVDFQKAYDLVPRHLLWVKLQRAGVQGWFLQAVQALYADVPMCVKTPAGCTETFQSLLGVKQGCPLSPNLFGMYVDDLERTILASAADMALPCMHDGQPVPPLLYADDLVLLATTPAGLQRQLNALHAYSNAWGLTVNAAKTKVVVFARRSTSSSTAGAAFTCGGAPITVESEFKYLGIQVHASHAFSRAAAARAAAGTRALHAMRRRCTELGLISPTLHMRMFDTMVLPVLSYGAEIWAPQLVAAAQECANSRVQLSFLRQMLGVRQSTASLVVLAETGRKPLAVHWSLQLARFWNTLLAADEGSLVQRALADSIALAAEAEGALAQRPWAAQFAAAMERMGVGINLQRPEQLCVADVREACMASFMRQFEEAQGTKIRHYIDTVRGGVNSDNYGAALYLMMVHDRARRRALAQLRTGAHWLAEETGRWQRVERQQRVCAHCAAHGQQHIETVDHFIFACPRTAHLRAQYPQLFPPDAQPSSLSIFFENDPIQLASFARACYCLEH